jgi:predicted metal-dependent enzyme (double-stranded beta helix superfamily)
MAARDGLPADVLDGPTNYAVGQILLGENDRVRVWEISLAPGERHHFHCHRTSYFWVAHTGARVRVSYPDGAVHDYEHQAGEVTYLEVPPGEPNVQDLTNTGDTHLHLTTIELLGNDRLFWRPLPADD